MVGAPRPKSPPDKAGLLYGNTRHSAKLILLEKEITSVQEEIKSLDCLQPSSRCCQEVNEFVFSRPDPLVATNQDHHKSNCCWTRNWVNCCCSGDKDNNSTRSSKKSSSCRQPNSNAHHLQQGCCCKLNCGSCCGLSSILSSKPKCCCGSCCGSGSCCRLKLWCNSGAKCCCGSA